MQLDPAIVAREFAAKRQEEVFKRELMTRLASVHVENSGRLFGRNRRICEHFTGRNRSDPLRRRRSRLSEEALHKTLTQRRRLQDQPRKAKTRKNLVQSMSEMPKSEMRLIN